MERSGHPAEGGATTAERSLFAAVTQGRAWTPEFHQIWLAEQGYESTTLIENRALARDDPDAAANDGSGSGLICAEFLRAMIVVEGANARNIPIPEAEAAILEKHDTDPRVLANVRGIEISWTDPGTAPIIQCPDVEDLGHVLDLRGVVFPKRLALEGCRFEAPDKSPASICLDEAEMKTIAVSRAHFSALRGDQLQVDGDFEAFKIKARIVDLSNSRIDGSVFLNGATIDPPDKAYAVKFVSARVTGDLQLTDRFVASGPVSFLSARVEGDVEFTGATLDSGGSPRALIGSGAKIAGDLFLNQALQADGQADKAFSAKGEVNLTGIRVGGVFSAEGGQFTAGDSKVAISCNRAQFGGSVYFRKKFVSDGMIDMVSVRIGDVFDCDDATMRAAPIKKLKEGDSEVALTAYAAEITGGLFMRDGFHAEGEVRLASARIGGELNCSNAKFLSRKIPRCLLLNNASINGSFQLGGPKFLAKGFISAYGMEIAGDLQLCRGVFDSGPGDADGAADSRAIDLQLARIAGRLVFATPGLNHAARARKARRGWFDRSRTKLERDLQASLPSIKGDLILSQASCAVLDDYAVEDFPNAAKDWITGCIELDGFTYDRLGTHSPKSARARMRWLKRQPHEDRWGKGFKPQPHEQLAEVLRVMGYLSSARDIAVSKQWRMHWSGKLHWTTALFRWVVMWPSGYGYRPQYPFLVGVLAVIMAYGVFEAAYRTGYMGPAQPHAVIADMAADIRRLDAIRTGTDAQAPDLCNLEEATEILPPFNGLTYAIDAFVPLVDLDQETSWKPGKTRRWTDDALTTRCLQQIADQNAPPKWWRWGWLRNPLSNAVQGSAPADGLHWIKWSLIVLGFAISALIAASISGLLRRD